MAVQKIDYLSRDFAGFKTSLLQYAQSTFPEWQPGSQGDFGVMLVELFSYMGDVISYYTDRAQFENYLPTATQRESLLNLAYILGYVPYSGSPATGTVSLVNVAGTATSTVVPAGLRVTTDRVESLDGPVVFETDTSVTLPANPSGTAVATSVPVTEGATESNLYLGLSTGVPGMVFTLPHPGVYQETVRVFVEDNTGSLVITPAGGGPAVTVREWMQVDRLLGQNGNDRTFETRISTTGTNVYFGDDLTGAIPARDMRIYATYRHGVGVHGNVAPGALQNVDVTGLTGLDSVRVAQAADGSYISSSMTGGADEESNLSIRTNAPRAFRAQDRVVTKEDYKAVALATPGVHTASVVSGSFTAVTIYVTGPGGSLASSTLKQEVTRRIESRALAGVTVTVSDPTFQPIDFGTVSRPILIVARAGHSLTDIKTAAETAITNLVTDLDAEEPLSAGKIYAALSAVNGIELVDVTVFSRQGAGAQTDTSVITPQPWEILVPGTITVSVV